MIARYGERFIEAGQFVKYCHDLHALHIDVYQSRREFERYVQEGKILPVAVVSRPVDPNSRQRSAMRRLEEPYRPLLESYRGIPDREIVHAFDRQMETNVLIGSPLLGKGQALQDLVLFGPTCRYYSYWQVNQVYELRNNTVLGKPNINSYNWLSYWVAMEIRERQRTYANVNRYQKRRQKNARKVQSAFGLGCSDYYDALRQLVDTYQDYMKNERRQLAEQIRQDALRMSELIRLNYGINFDGISEELAKFSAWHAMKFRSFDIATKERDAAKRVISRLVMGIMKMNEADIDDLIASLLDHCERELPVLITALSGVYASGQEELIKFRHANLYTNLKNILTLIEPFIKGIVPLENIDPKHPMTTLIEKITSGEKWSKGLNRGIEHYGTTGSLDNLNKVMAANSLAYWPKTFLTVCIARNMMAHNFLKEDHHYGDLYDDILKASIAAILQIWRRHRHGEETE